MSGGSDHPQDAGADDGVLDEPPEGALRELAIELGVSLDYWDWQGRYVPVSARTVRGVLRGLGLDVVTPESAREALAEIRARPWRRMLPPCVVVRAGQAATSGCTCPTAQRS